MWCNYVPDGLRSQIFNHLAEDEALLNVSPDVNMVDCVLCVVSEYEGLVTFMEVNTEYDTSERREAALGGIGVE